MRCEVSWFNQNYDGQSEVQNDGKSDGENGKNIDWNSRLIWQQSFVVIELLWEVFS